ncbi:hypothetical protein EXW34_31295 (plasmid) [Bacillus mycoides]|uniref:hypothetical protein n=1 Tax=Bacillus mycoides TaxID=1405 RepID=UPI001C038EED|nr:hypothetical protein [Bacillus mycoides]QWI25658.1 hypothetical protein EXW34_31295 [Bacillus mycoides]
MNRKKTFEIGKDFPWDMWKNRFSMVYSGLIGGGFQYNRETNGLALIIFKADVTGMKKSAIKEGEVNFRIYQKGDNVLPLIMFGKSPGNFLIDLPCFFTEYDSELDFNCLSNKLHIVYLDTLTVEFVREVEMNPRVHRRLVNAWNENIRNEFFLDEYREFLADAYENYPSELWDITAIPFD